MCSHVPAVQTTWQCGDGVQCLRYLNGSGMTRADNELDEGVFLGELNVVAFDGDRVRESDFEK